MNERNPSPSSGHRLPIESGEPAVPTFGCVVYFTRSDAEFTGRVANLAGIEATGRTQRELLSEIVKRFKAKVSEAIAAGETPDWTEPPLEKQAGETKVFLPVHL